MDRPKKEKKSGSVYPNVCQNLWKGGWWLVSKHAPLPPKMAPSVKQLVFNMKQLMVSAANLRTEEAKSEHCIVSLALVLSLVGVLQSSVTTEDEL